MDLEITKKPRGSFCLSVDKNLELIEGNGILFSSSFFLLMSVRIICRWKKNDFFTMWKWDKMMSIDTLNETRKVTHCKKIIFLLFVE